MPAQEKLPIQGTRKFCSGFLYFFYQRWHRLHWPLCSSSLTVPGAFPCICARTLVSQHRNIWGGSSQRTGEGTRITSAWNKNPVSLSQQTLMKSSPSQNSHLRDVSFALELIAPFIFVLIRTVERKQNMDTDTWGIKRVAGERVGRKKKRVAILSSNTQKWPTLKKHSLASFPGT